MITLYTFFFRQMQNNIHKLSLKNNTKTVQYLYGSICSKMGQVLCKDTIYCNEFSDPSRKYHWKGWWHENLAPHS